MIEFLESVLRGLGLGSAYALLAIGFVIIFKSTGVVSFAQPAMMLTGAVVVSYLSPEVGFFAAMALGFLALAALGLFVERTAIRPMVGRPVFVVAIITIGIDIAVRVVANGFIGLGARPIGDPWGISRLSIGELEVQWRHLAMMVTTAIVLAVLFWFFRYTRYGLAMRATAFDQEAALTQGVNVGSVFALSWALAAGLAAIAGSLLATGTGVDRQLWIITLVALPAIILGGLDSLEGAVIGGLVVGVVESLVGTYQSQLAPWLGNNFASVSPYVVMLLVLMIRPYGLFGTPEVERV
ncbi:MAG: branched-chain amino acid ABC transporter permease [Nocardioides sp.]